MRLKHRILIIEDDQMIREAIKEYLVEMNYEVIEAEDGQEGLQLFRDSTFDLVILDIMLPKLNGFVVLNQIREISDVPVMMLTAMTDEYTQIMSFDEKADDYIAKPFSIVVLHKRIEALLRRENKRKEVSTWEYQDIKVDFLGYTARKGEEQVDLKPKEIQLLKLLLKHKGKVLTRQQMIDAVWNINEMPTDRVIDVYIKNLRKKLQLSCIVTVKGIGYKFEEEQCES